MLVTPKKEKRFHEFFLVFPPLMFLRKWSLFTSTVTYLYIYIYTCHQKKIVIERTRDLIYLKFVATDFSQKIISPNAGENSGDSA